MPIFFSDETIDKKDTCLSLFPSLSRIYISVTVVFIITIITTIGAITIQLHHNSKSAQAPATKSTCSKILKSPIGITMALSVSIALSAVSRIVFINMLNKNQEETSSQTVAILLIFSFSSTVVNPFVQIFLRKDLQNALRNYFLSWTCDHTTDPHSIAVLQQTQQESTPAAAPVSMIGQEGTANPQDSTTIEEEGMPLVMMNPSQAKIKTNFSGCCMLHE